MIIIYDSNFYCSGCKNPITVESQNHGKGFRARCKICKKTSFYPACEECEQPKWNHNDEQHEVIVARHNGLQFCRKCKKAKSKDEFNMNGKTLASRCKPCQAEYFAEWYAKKSRTAKTFESSEDEETILAKLFG